MAKNKIIDNQVEAVDEVIREDALLTGVVTDCFRLNIRKEPDKAANIVTVVDILTQLKIDEKQSQITGTMFSMVMEIQVIV